MRAHANKSTSVINDAEMQRFFLRKCGSGLLKKKKKEKSLRPFADELLRFCRCEAFKASGTFDSKTDSSPNLPTFKRIKHWSFMNMEGLCFEIK